MSDAILWNGYVKRRAAFFAWREELPWVKKFFLAFAMASFTGLCAQIRMTIPGTPVPVTGQTFAVLLSGVVIGRRWGGVSQILYVALGACGWPWFAGFSGGAAVLSGPTAGYLVGFVLAALFLGHMTDRERGLRGFFPMAGLMWFASFVLIQIPGLLGLALWHRLALGEVPALSALIAMGMLPFVVGDVLKIMLAALFAKAVTPK
jgi:biotin transport system substrate-specific component